MKLLIFFCIYFSFFTSFLLNAQQNFQYTFSAGGDDIIEWIIPSNDGNLILGGNTNSFDNDVDGLVMKIDLNGNIIWSKTFGGTNADQIVRVISCFDGGYVAIGYTSSFGHGSNDAWITRIGENGEVVWSDCFGTYSSDAARAVTQTTNGDFIIEGQEYNFLAGFILRLNSNGDFVWKKEFTKGIVFWFNDVLETTNGEILSMGGINHSGFGGHDDFILKTSSTGNIIQCRYYGAQQDEAYRTLVPYENGYLIIADNWSWQNHCMGFIAKLNSNLGVEDAIVFGDNTVNQLLESACFLPNSICAAIKLPNREAYIVEVDPSLNLKKSWKFKPGTSAYSSHIISLTNGSVIFAGSTTNEQTSRKDIYINKFDPSDPLYTCNTVLHNTYLEHVNIQMANLSIDETDNNPELSHINIQSNNVTLIRQDLCELLPIANFTGPSQICANESVTFENNSQNGQTYHWTFQGGIPSESDSFDPGTITYNTPGYFSIKLVVTNNNGADSIIRYITVNPSPDVFLGPDTTLQEGESLYLEASPGMDSYLWQDGSLGQIFKVTEEGMYWVTVEKDGCFATDTIIVTYGDCLAAFYCTDQACVYQTVSITNYCKTSESYQWYFEGAVPSSSTSSDPGFIHYEYPGTFMIKLVVTNNNIQDSVIKYIDVYPQPEVSLGCDTIVPMGESLILDAGLYMDHYLWQDGSAEQTFEVFQDGMYWVRVIKNNCVDFDTIFVTFDDCIASLEVPNCFTPNGDGINETFKAESHNLTAFTMLIYNRWGQQLFESEDPEKGWDGKVNGQLCPIGTYFYLIRYLTKCSSGVDKDGVKKGSVTLLE